MKFRAIAALFLIWTSFGWASLEVGVGATLAHVPHYIGSDESNDFLLPFPYIRYRSEKLNIDRNLIQGNLWKHGNWSLEISLGGSIKVDSDENQARKGMDDLDFIIEAGPALHYYFLGDRTKDNALFLDLPIRLATSTDFTAFRDQGFTSIPRVVWRRGYMLAGYEVRPQISAGVRLGSERYHDYIYGVPQDVVTADRAAYEGSDGYGGFQLAYSTAVLWGPYMTALGLRYVNIRGASYEDSPLVTTKTSVLAGFAFAYLF